MLTFKMGESLIAAACTIAVMTIPVIVTATREALASVPQVFVMPAGTWVQLNGRLSEQ